MIIGSKVIRFDTLPSTNTYASLLLRSEKPSEGSVITADFQSGGRGQTGNKWESEAGKNLLFSTILYPETINPADQFILSMAISLGICETLDRYIDGSKIKWPNDIYVNNDKIAGILIECSILGSQIENCVAGIGLNINQSIYLSEAPNPVSMLQLTGIEYDRNEIFAQLIFSLDKRYKQLLSEDYEKIRTEYENRLYRINAWAKYSDRSGTFEGRIISVNKDGVVTVEKKGTGKFSDYSFKEIEFIQ